MKQRTLLLLTILFALGATNLHAQGFGGGGMLAGLTQSPVERILARADSLALELTTEQTTQLQGVQAEVAQKNEAPQRRIQEMLQGLQSGGAPDMSALQALQPLAQQIQANNAEALTKAREVLSAEQWTKADAFLQATTPRMGQGGGGGFGGGFGG